MRKKTILVVDDEPDLCEIICDLLSDSLQVFNAANGRRALKILAMESIDFILSDIDMPEMSGIELLTEVRKLSASVPFCLFTGGSKMERAGALSLGANFFLHKSDLNPETLKAIIASAFS